MANNSKTDKGTFILRSDFYPQVQLLTREQRGDLLTAIFAYTSEEEIPHMDCVTKMCFEFIKVSIDFYAEKYNAECKKNRENGRKGGRPRKVDEKDKNRTDSEKTERFLEQPIGIDEAEREVSKPTGKRKTGRISEKPNGIIETECLMQESGESEKTERSKKNRYSYCECDNDSYCDSSTHTVADRKEGGVGETIAEPPKKPVNVEAAKLLAWIAATVPSVASMAEPLTEQNIVWMLRKYTVEDIQRIIQAMYNKRAFKNISAYATFTNFAKYDKELAERRNAISASAPKPYTREAVLEYIDRHREFTTSDFERREDNGRVVWYKKSDL